MENQEQDLTGMVPDYWQYTIRVHPKEFFNHRIAFIKSHPEIPIYITNIVIADSGMYAIFYCLQDPEKELMQDSIENLMLYKYRPLISHYVMGKRVIFACLN